MDANELFTRAFMRIMRGWSVIFSFRKVGFAGMPYAKAIVHREHRLFLDELMESGQFDRMIIRIKDDADRERAAKLIHEKLTEMALQNAASSVDAASIVFAHSVLDEALSDFLEVTTLVCGEAWEERLQGRKAELRDVKTSGYVDLLKQMIAEEVNRVRRNASIGDKADLLHALCKPEKPPSGPATYKFDKQMLFDLDWLRQQIVHGDTWGSQIPDVPSKLDYLQNTAYYFFMMLNQALGVRLDPTKMSA
jgi:hypothetical protein